MNIDLTSHRKTGLASAVVLLVSSVAAAGGLEMDYPDGAAAALGRGGAFVARADDPSALSYNPAGLGHQSGFNVTLSVSAAWLAHRFEPAPDQVELIIERRFEPVEQQSDLFVAPMLLAHFDFESLPEWDFGVGVYGPPAIGKRRFDNQWTIAAATRRGEDATERIKGSPASALVPNGLLVESDLLLAYPTVAAAWSPTPNWRLGVSLQAAVFKGEITQGIGGAVPALVTLSVEDWFTPTAILGAQYSPWSWLEVGLSMRPPLSIDAQGRAKVVRFAEPCPDGPCPADLSTVRLGPYALGASLPLLMENGQEDDGASLRFELPLVVRAGVRYLAPSGRFDVEADYLYQRLSTHRRFEIRFDAHHTQLPTETGALDDIALPEIDDLRAYQDTHGLRLGSEVRLNEWGSVRLGGSLESAASPSAYTHLDSPGLGQWSVSAGGSVHIGAITLDAGYAYLGFLEREVSESDVRMVDITTTRDRWKVVGNGVFSGACQVLSLSATLHLD